ncbi:hypothetical protein SAMN05216464_102156 [Mucilaginibacter pineti]|uniref:LTXXQ motif family protein n=1 Tax=Mucilaginibacter pineti TaxID=1391627 RepID=A0A1G6WER0_9SPHI|nr:hypothetical protein [Mucilaginibacter pineti]SDD64321.1 hypothetical protein SAMN05216464_102156 [Mucilaginibacter pineti]
MSNLIRFVFVLFFTVAAGYESFAQVRNNLQPSQRVSPENKGKKGAMGKKLEAARQNFINRQLSLTDNESTKFWPIYNQYQQELTAVRILKRLNNSSTAANGTEQIDKEIYYESQLVAIRKRYKDAFLKILPPEKVSELYKSEREFNDELIKRLSESSERAGN